MLSRNEWGFHVHFCTPTFHPPTQQSSGSCIIVHIPRLWMTTQKCGFWKVDFCTLTSQLGLSHTPLFCQHHHSMHVPWPWQGPCTRIYLLLSVHLPIPYIAHIRMVIQKVSLERLIFVCSLSQLDPPTGHPTIWYHHSMHVPSRIHHPWRQDYTLLWSFGMMGWGCPTWVGVWRSGPEGQVLGVQLLGVVRPVRPGPNFWGSNFSDATFVTWCSSKIYLLFSNMMSGIFHRWSYMYIGYPIGVINSLLVSPRFLSAITFEMTIQNYLLPESGYREESPSRN